MTPDVIHGPGATMPRHKPSLSDMCDICGPAQAERKARGQRIAALHRSLREFGYPLTLAETAAAYDIAIDHEPTAQDGIIPRLIRSQLQEAGLSA